MSNINKISVNGTVYDIEDTTARTSSGVGLTDDIKMALLNCFEKVAWIDQDGQDYYDALEEALYPPANLTSISCVYTQSGTVYETDSLDSLKSDLVVTAHYDDSSTATVTTYTLSGTLTVGTSTITVSYGGKTTTFTVTVSEYVTPPIYNWNLKNSLTDTVNGVVATPTNATFTEGTGIVYTTTNSYTQASISRVITNTTIEIDVASAGSKAGGNHRRLSMCIGSNSAQAGGLIYRSTGTWAFFNGTTWDSSPTLSNDFSTNNTFQVIDGKTVKIYVNSSNYLTAYLKDIGASDSTYTKVFESSIAMYSSIYGANATIEIGANDSNDSVANATITGWRVYEGEK